MSTPDWDTPCSIVYHLREGLAGTAAVLCDEALRKSRNNPFIQLLNAVALINIGRRAEAMRTLNDLRKDGVVGFACLVALRAAHAMAANPDRDSMKEIDKEINSQWTSSSPEQAEKAALTIMLFGGVDKVRSLLDNAITKDPASPQLNTLKGWMELQLGRDAKLALNLFDGAIAAGYPDAYLGKARLLQQRHNVSELGHAMYELTTKSALFLPGHIEYARALIMARDWDRAVEQAQRTILIKASFTHAAPRRWTLHTAHYRFGGCGSGASS